MEKNDRLKRYIIYIVTVIVSVIYIFIGNKIATKNMSKIHNISSTPVKAKVVSIIEKSELDYNMSGDNSMIGEKILFEATILNGEDKGNTVIARQEINTFYALEVKDVEVDDKILLLTNPDVMGAEKWVFAEYIRIDSIILLGIVFCIFLLVFGRGKGVNTIISIIFTCLAVFAVFIPSILSGLNIYVWSIVTCIFIIIMTLLIVNGANKKSLAAGIGCFSGILVTGILTFIMDKIIKLTGMVNDESLYLHQLNPENPIDLKAIIFAAIIIGAIGAIMDVAISISSALLEIHENSEKSSFRMLLKSGMTIGRDIMGTMSNTLILAYIGSSLSVVLLLVAYNNSLIGLLNREMIVVEILQSLVGSFGILATIPLTSAICATLYSKRQLISR